MQGRDILESIKAGSQLSPGDIGALCRLVKDQETQIVQLRSEIRKLRAGAPAMKVARAQENLRAGIYRLFRPARPRQA